MSVSTRLGWFRNAVDIVVTISMMAACIAIVVWILRTNEGTSSEVLEVTEQTVGISGAPTKGAKLAKAGVLIFSDFDCPYCSSFALGRLGQATDRYVAEEKLLLAFRSLPLAIHPTARLAAIAAACAGAQGEFWQMHDWLFTNRKSRDLAAYEVWAERELHDKGKFTSCVDSEGPALVDFDVKEAKGLGIASTPTVFVGVMQDETTLSIVRQFVGVPDAQSFEAAIRFAVDYDGDRMRW